MCPSSTSHCVARGQAAHETAGDAHQRTGARVPCSCVRVGSGRIILLVLILNIIYMIRIIPNTQDFPRYYPTLFLMRKG